MASARLDIRLDEEIKAKAEKATALLGMNSLTEYIIKLLEQDANQVIAQHESITIEDDVFDRFIDACEMAKEPNAALKKAAAFSRKLDIK